MLLVVPVEPLPAEAIPYPPNLDLDHLLVTAETVARACGRLTRDERPDQVRVAATKTSATDVVTLMDRRSEDLAHSLLREQRPADGIVGEEGVNHPGTSGITWLVDPIDGTVNYLYGRPEYAVSVAAVAGDTEHDGAWYPLAGAVYHPATDDVYLARRGGGSRWLRGATAHTLAVHPAETLGQSLVGTGFAYDPQVRRRQGDLAARVLPQVRDLRRTGCASLDLCAVATGQLDAYYESGLNAWDYAAAWVVVEEAGGHVLGDAGGRPGRDLTVAGAGASLIGLQHLVTAIDG